MFKLLPFATLALSAFVTVNAVVIPRATAPSTYDTDILENYTTYNTRYLALDCEDKHNTSFFDNCCHPLKLDQKLSDRPAFCTPAATSSSSSAPAPSHSPTQAPAPPQNVGAAPSSPSPSPSPSPASQSFTGHATWFYQHSTAGACGKVHAETDKVIALDAALYGDTGAVSKYCGKSLVLTNKSNGKSVTATVADACPTCDSFGSIDLSQGAFLAVAADLGVGEFDVEWSFIN